MQYIRDGHRHRCEYRGLRLSLAIGLVVWQHSTSYGSMQTRTTYLPQIDCRPNSLTSFGNPAWNLGGSGHVRTAQNGLGMMSSKALNGQRGLRKVYIQSARLIILTSKILLHICAETKIERYIHRILKHSGRTKYHRKAQCRGERRMQDQREVF